MENIYRNLRFVGKPGKIISLIFLIPSFIVVITCLILELFFNDFYQILKGGSSEEPNYAGVAILFVFILILMLFIVMKVISIFTLVVSSISLILSICCLCLANIEEDLLLENKKKIYIIFSIYVFFKVIFGIFAIIFLINDGGMFVLSCVVLAVCYGVASSKMINSINILNNIDI